MPQSGPDCLSSGSGQSEHSFIESAKNRVSRRMAVLGHPSYVLATQWAKLGRDDPQFRNAVCLMPRLLKGEKKHQVSWHMEYIEKEIQNGG